MADRTVRLRLRKERADSHSAMILDTDELGPMLDPSPAAMATYESLSPLSPPRNCTNVEKTQVKYIK